jgi:hypothetical protein
MNIKSYKESIVKDLGKTFELLENDLPATSDTFDKLVLIKSRYLKVRNDNMLNIISSEEFNLNLSKIRYDLLQLINEIGSTNILKEEEDIPDKQKNYLKNLNDYLKNTSFKWRNGKNPPDHDLSGYIAEVDDRFLTIKYCSIPEFPINYYDNTPTIKIETTLFMDMIKISMYEIFDNSSGTATISFRSDVEKEKYSAEILEIRNIHRLDGRIETVRRTLANAFLFLPDKLSALKTIKLISPIVMTFNQDFRPMKIY